MHALNMQTVSVRSPTCTASLSRQPMRHALHGPIFRRSTVSGLKQASQSARRRSVRPESRKLVTTMGLPIPIIGPLFNPTFGLIAYAIGASRFYSNFDRTSYDSTQKTKLTALWPVLLIGSEKFRDEFKKAIGQ